MSNAYARFLRAFFLISLLFLSQMLVFSEDQPKGEELTGWAKVVSMLSLIPTDDELDAAFEYISGFTEVGSPPATLTIESKNCRLEMDRMVPIDMSTIGLKPYFNAADKLPPPEFERMTKRQAAKSLFKRFAVRLLRIRLFLEGRMKKGERELTEIERALISRYLLLSDLKDIPEFYNECTRPIAEWYYKHCKALDEKHGLTATIDNEIASRLKQLPIKGETLPERLASWALVADCAERNRLSSGALFQWLIENCSQDFVLKLPEGQKVVFQQGVVGIYEDYVSKEFIALDEIKKAEEASPTPMSTFLKLRLANLFLLPNISDEFMTTSLYGALTFKNIKGSGMAPLYNSTTAEISRSVYARKRYLNYATFKQLDSQTKLELIDSGEAGDGFFLSTTKPDENAVTIQIEEDSIYPMLFWESQSTRGLRNRSSMYQDQIQFMSALNKSGLLYFCGRSHYLTDDPDITKLNCFKIGTELSYDLSDTGKKALVADEDLQKLFTKGEGVKASYAPRVDNMKFGFFYHYPRTKYYIYKYVSYDSTTGQHAWDIPLCLVVILPGDCLPDEAFICPYRNQFDSAIKKCGLQIYGWQMWTARDFYKREERLFKHIGDLSIKINDESAGHYTEYIERRKAYEEKLKNPD